MATEEQINGWFGKALDHRYKSFAQTPNDHQFKYHGGNEIKPKGEHKDEGKSRLELIDPYFLEQMGLVLGFGAGKYSPNNWRNGIEYSRLIGSALRHITAFNRGEDLDPESGLPHLAHAGCCVMMLLGTTKIHPEMDDRCKSNG